MTLKCYIYTALVKDNKMKESKKIEARIGLTNFSDGMTSDTISSLKAILLATQDLDSQQHFEGCEDTGHEPADSLRSIGWALVKLQREITAKARQISPN